MRNCPNDLQSGWQAAVYESQSYAFANTCCGWSQTFSQLSGCAVMAHWGFPDNLEHLFMC